jgi:hypothetical protein
VVRRYLYKPKKKQSLFKNTANPAALPCNPKFLSVPSAVQKCKKQIDKSNQNIRQQLEWDSNVKTTDGNLARYIVRVCFSQERMIYIPDKESDDSVIKVVYISKDHNHWRFLKVRLHPIETRNKVICDQLGKYDLYSITVDDLLVSPFQEYYS